MRRRRRASARVRIVAMTVAIVAVALFVTVLLLRQVLIADQDRRVNEALEQEANELAEFLDAQTIEPGQSVDEFSRDVLRSYLSLNVTVAEESLTVVQGGVALFQTPEAPGDIRPFIDRFADTTDPVTIDVTTDGGPARVLAQPVLDGDGEQSAVLAIAWFLDDERDRINTTIRNAALVALASLVVAAALAWIVAGRVLQPIGMLATTARQITEDDLDRRLPVQGSDEIASLISSFNAMVDRLQLALSTQRRFLDDAGHELRTPITILRGHLELAQDDPESFRESAEVVLAELDRMARIVDDLLLLARAEQVDFLAVHPIDVDEFTDALLARSRSLGPQHWMIDGSAVGVIEADPDRLTQAVLNLAANAARHTPADGTIGIGTQWRAGGLALWVRDSGEGIAPEHQERIFERFARPSGTRSSGGSAGLGLAIVAAIADAHGGTVAVDSDVGRGATFTITIPAVGGGGGAPVSRDADGPTRADAPDGPIGPIGPDDPDGRDTSATRELPATERAETPWPAS